MPKTICTECIHYKICFYRLRSKDFAGQKDSYGMYEYLEGNSIQYAFETVAAKRCKYNKPKADYRPEE